ncbi:MAG: hypothetical protein ACE5OO_00095 [Candidatus Bathyarchaeia archaeon]
MKKNRGNRFTLLFTPLIAVLFLSTVGCSGSLARSMDLDELTREADVILVGTVEEITTNWGGESGVFRIVEVRVDEYLKNNMKSRSVFIRVLGGQMGSTGVWVEDQPDFAVSERVLVFLRESSEGAYQVLNGPQGKFTIASGAATNEAGEKIIDGERVGDVRFVLDPRPNHEIILSSLVLVGAAFLVIYYRNPRLRKRRARGPRRGPSGPKPREVAGSSP